MYNRVLSVCITESLFFACTAEAELVLDCCCLVKKGRLH